MNKLYKLNKQKNINIEVKNDKQSSIDLKSNKNNEKKIKNKNEHISYISSKKNILKEIDKNKNENSGDIGNKKNKKNKLKRSSSHPFLKNKKYFIDNEDINANIKIRKIKSEKQYSKNIKLIYRDKNKDRSTNYVIKKKNILFSKKNKRHSNINENLNINEILSEKRKNITLINNEKKTPTHIKNVYSSQINFYKKKINDSTLNSARKKDKQSLVVGYSTQTATKIAGRKFLIKRNKNKDNNDETSTTNKKSQTQRRQITPNKVIEKPKSKEIKSVLFSHRNSKNSKTIIYQPGRNQNNENLLEKCSSTNDSSAKKQINYNKATQFKTMKSNSIKIKGNIFKNDKKQNEINKYEIKTTKSESFIRNCIMDCIGYNNLTISTLSQEHTKFSCKIYIGKKKVNFNFNLMKNDKNKNIILGEFIDGDIQNYEKIFAKIKAKLE